MPESDVQGRGAECRYSSKKPTSASPEANLGELCHLV
jgi:hypothetical protein